MHQRDGPPLQALRRLFHFELHPPPSELVILCWPPSHQRGQVFWSLHALLRLSFLVRAKFSVNFFSLQFSKESETTEIHNPHQWPPNSRDTKDSHECKHFFFRSDERFHSARCKETFPFEILHWIGCCRFGYCIDRLRSDWWVSVLWWKCKLGADSVHSFRWAFSRFCSLFQQVHPVWGNLRRLRVYRQLLSLDFSVLQLDCSTRNSEIWKISTFSWWNFVGTRKKIVFFAQTKFGPQILPVILHQIEFLRTPRRHTSRVLNSSGDSGDSFPSVFWCFNKTRNQLVVQGYSKFASKL